MKDNIKCISEEELKKLLELYNTAQNTPVITMSVNEPSFAERAWDLVRDFQKELGEKYNYDWEKHGINGKGEILPI